MVRSRRAGAGPDRPMYARMLGLRHVAPSGFLYFVFLEGAVTLGILLALAELVSWWGVLVLPLTVAGMVKLNDVVAGALAKSAPPTPATPPPARPVTRRDDLGAEDLSPAWPVARRDELGAEDPRPARPVARRDELADEDLALSRARTVDLRRLVQPAPEPRQWAGELDMREQRARQSAARRYE